MEHLVFIKPGPPVDECSIELRNHLEGFISAPIQEVHQEKITTYAQNSTGTIIGGILADLHEYQLVIQGIWVSGAERGHSVGRKLLGLIQDYAEKKGLGVITFTTTHLRLVEFFVHNGFELISTSHTVDTDTGQYYLEKSCSISHTKPQCLEDVLLQ